MLFAANLGSLSLRIFKFTDWVRLSSIEIQFDWVRFTLPGRQRLQCWNWFGREIKSQLPTLNRWPKRKLSWPFSCTPLFNYASWKQGQSEAYLKPNPFHTAILMTKINPENKQMKLCRRSYYSQHKADLWTVQIICLLNCPQKVGWT